MVFTRSTNVYVKYTSVTVFIKDLYEKFEFTFRESKGVDEFYGYSCTVYKLESSVIV